MNPRAERSDVPFWPMPERTDWAGRWIWSTATAGARNAYAFFRRPFAVPAAGTITLRITADTSYVLFIDGGLIVRGPSRGHLDWYPFDTMTLPLSSGRHVLAVLAHHIGVINGTAMTGGPGVLADVTVEGAGVPLDLSTGPEWRCLAPAAWRRDLPCLMSHFGFWEECDLRQLPAGWTTPAFDDSAWMPAAVIGQPPCPPWTRLVERDIPLPVRATVSVARVSAGGTWCPGNVEEDGEAKRKSVAGGWLDGASTTTIPSKQVAARCRAVDTPPSDFPVSLEPSEATVGRWLTVDFGRTVSGYPVLEFADAQDGVTVDLSYDDLPGVNGAVNPERSYARLTDRFILAAGSCTLTTVNPRGFRYLMVDVGGSGCVVMRSVYAVEETYPFQTGASTFECSDGPLTHYVAKAAETVRICATDCFTDCATRERVQWMEDLYLHARVAAYAFGDTALLRRALFQAAQNALPDGRINAFMPSERTALTFASASLLWLHALVDYWLFAGDEATVRSLLPTAARVLAYARSVSDDSGLIADWPGGQFWDWAPIEAGGCLALTNAAYIWALVRLGEHAVFTGTLGSDLAERAAALRTGAHRRFWDEGRCLYRDGSGAEPPVFSQHANALAVLAGVCPAAERAALLRRITDPRQLGPVPVGEQAIWNGPRPGPETIVPVGTLWFAHFICQALFENGMADEALAQMHAFWGAHDNLPTFPETRIQAGNTFLCHGWAAGPAFLLPAYVLGARPLDAGWSRIVVSPLPGGLASASGVIPTPHGPLRVAWHRGADERIALKVNAPPGIRVVPDKESVARKQGSAHAVT